MDVIRKNPTKVILLALLTIGVIIVLAGLLIIGIKHMTATPEEAKKLRSKLIGLVVAGIVIIGAYSIWRLVGTFLYNVADGTSTNVAIPTASPKQHQ